MLSVFKPMSDSALKSLFSESSVVKDRTEEDDFCDMISVRRQEEGRTLTKNYQGQTLEEPKAYRLKFRELCQLRQAVE